MRLTIMMFFMVTLVYAISKDHYEKYMTLIEKEKYEEIGPILDSLEKHKGGIHFTGLFNHMHL